MELLQTPQEEYDSLNSAEVECNQLTESIYRELENVEVLNVKFLALEKQIYSLFEGIHTLDETFSQCTFFKAFWMRRQLSAEKVHAMMHPELTQSEADRVPFLKFINDHNLINTLLDELRNVINKHRLDVKLFQSIFEEINNLSNQLHEYQQDRTDIGEQLMENMQTFRIFYETFSAQAHINTSLDEFLDCKDFDVNKLSRFERAPEVNPSWSRLEDKRHRIEEERLRKEDIRRKEKRNGNFPQESSHDGFNRLCRTTEGLFSLNGSNASLLDPINLPIGQPAGTTSSNPLKAYSFTAACNNNHFTETTVLDKLRDLFNNCSRRLEHLVLKTKDREASSSIFAPAQVETNSHMLVQLFLHAGEPGKEIATWATHADPRAQLRDQTPMNFPLKNGDKVEIKLAINGKSCLYCECKSIYWREKSVKCTFDYYVPETIDVKNLHCLAELFVNDALIGEMNFVTEIVQTPSEKQSSHLAAIVNAQIFHKIFISYSHIDTEKVKFLAAAYKAQGVDYFFDSDILRGGDLYKDKIYKYIDTSDLFILCWSQNSAASEPVRNELKRALLHAKQSQVDKQVEQAGQPLEESEDSNEGKLTIYPLCFDPRAELPTAVLENYHCITM